MRRRASIALTAILVSAAFGDTGCYLSRRLQVDAGPIDAEVGRDAGVDAGPPTCCTDWRFERRVLVDGFGDEQTVTPRLIELEHAPAVIVTGPSDPVGPSGAHLIRFSADLGAQSAPVAVTSGSFTWGQPASSGDRFAVCWGTGGGRNVARLYDSVGAPVSEIITLDPDVRSPCIDAAFSHGQFAFVYEQDGPEEADAIHARMVEASTFTVGTVVGLTTNPEAPSASIVATNDGFALAVTDVRSTVVISFDRIGAVPRGLGIGEARTVQLVQHGNDVEALWVVERSISLTRSADVWLQQSLDLVAWRELGPEREFNRFEPSASPTFDATSDACGTPMLGTSTPSLMRVELTGLVEFMPDAPPGTLAGDTSVLVLGTDAYVAFSANSPSLNPQVHVDHYVCIAE